MDDTGDNSSIGITGQLAKRNIWPDWQNDDCPRILSLHIVFVVGRPHDVD
jgi:hypothetical protein